MMLRRLWRKRWALRSLAKTIYFNFHYLPLRQAVKLPIVLYKPHFKALKGRIELTAPARFGMVNLGHGAVSLYPNSGIVIENHGGVIRLGDNVCIGGASAVSIGPKGELTIDGDFMANAALRLACYQSITFGTRCRLAWECTVFDTDFHALTLPDGSLTDAVAPIVIGDNCWLGTQTLVLKGTRLPACTTVQARSTLSRDLSHLPERTVIGPDVHIKAKRIGIYRDVANDIPPTLK